VLALSVTLDRELLLPLLAFEARVGTGDAAGVEAGELPTDPVTAFVAAPTTEFSAACPTEEAVDMEVGMPLPPTEVGPATGGAAATGAVEVRSEGK
jgi:hypothetical protein